MRSLLFVPADSPRKLEKAIGSGADALILDLEDSVGSAGKGRARRLALEFLREHGSRAGRPRLYVRINAFESGLAEADLEAVMAAAPDGVMLPKCGGGDDVARLDSQLAVSEALQGMADGRTRIAAIATETAAALFGAGTYRGASPRLDALTWGGEDLAADIGAIAPRDGGGWSSPFQLARNLCLFGAAAAGVDAIDTVHTDFRDLAGLRGEAERAAADGFSGKLAIHPEQVPVINEVFTPSAAALDRARAVVAAFARAGEIGVVSIDGRMVDRPHLRAAERLLARAARLAPGNQG